MNSLTASVKKRKNSDAMKNIRSSLPSPPSLVVNCCKKVGTAKYFFEIDGRPSKLALAAQQIRKDPSKMTLFLICMCVTAIAMCQNLMAPNLTEIAASYNITDSVERDEKMGGQLSTAFFVFSMPFFLTVGYMTDRYDRRRLLLGITLANCLSTLMTAFTSTFFHLFLLRVVSGGTVMSVLPLGYSVLGDLFPPKRRGSMGTWLIVSMGAGTILGQLMSGLLGPTIGWRTTFMFASAPGIFMTWFCYTKLSMPKRGEMDAAEARRAVEMTDLEDPNGGGSPLLGGGIDSGEERDSLTIFALGGGDDERTSVEEEDVGGGGGGSGGGGGGRGRGSGSGSGSGGSGSGERDHQHRDTKDLLKVIFSTKTNILLFAQCIPGSVPWGVLFVFMNDFLAQDKGLTVEQATMMISLFGIGAAVGGAIGGVLGQYMYNVRSRNLSLFMGIVQLCSVPLMWRIIDAEYTSMNLAMNVVIILFAGCIASMAGTNVRFLLINVNEPDTRGFVMSIFDVFNNIGRGLGPLMVTWMVGAMGSRARGYDIAMTAWWLDALFMALTFFTVEEDEAMARGGKKRGKNKS